MNLNACQMENITKEYMDQNLISKIKDSKELSLNNPKKFKLSHIEQKTKKNIEIYQKSGVYTKYLNDQ